MKWVNQKTNQDCFACSLSMISGLPYEKVRRASRNVCKTYRPSRRRGMKTEKMASVCESIGIKYFVPDDGQYFSLASVAKGNRAILVVIWDHGESGHAIAWDGFNLYDPDDKSQTKISFYKYLETNQHRIKNYYISVAVKTPLLNRIASIAYSFFQVAYYDTKNDLNTFKRKFYNARWRFSAAIDSRRRGRVQSAFDE